MLNVFAGVYKGAFTDQSSPEQEHILAQVRLILQHNICARSLWLRQAIPGRIQPPFRQIQPRQPGKLGDLGAKAPFQQGGLHAGFSKGQGLKKNDSQLL